MEEPHLHFFLTAPTGEPSKAIVVNISTYHEQNCPDDSLILEAGDHPDIHHKSYVWFARASHIQVEPLILSIQHGSATVKRRGSSDLVSKIRNAFLKSDEVPRSLKKILAAAVLAEKVAREQKGEKG